MILKFKDIDQLGIAGLEVYAKRLSEKINCFRKIDIPVDTLGAKDAQGFETLTANVNSDSFVSKANSVLDADKNLSQSKKTKNFISEKLQDLSQKIQDKAEDISETIYTIDESGKWAVFEDIKDLFTKWKNQYQYNDKQKEETKILARIVDSLPTLNK